MSEKLCINSYNCILYKKTRYKNLNIANLEGKIFKKVFLNLRRKIREYSIKKTYILRSNYCIYIQFASFYSKNHTFLIKKLHLCVPEDLSTIIKQIVYLHLIYPMICMVISSKLIWKNFVYFICVTYCE